MLTVIRNSSSGALLLYRQYERFVIAVILAAVRLRLLHLLRLFLLLLWLLFLLFRWFLLLFGCLLGQNTLHVLGSGNFGVSTLLLLFHGLVSLGCLLGVLASLIRSFDFSALVLCLVFLNHGAIIVLLDSIALFVGLLWERAAHLKM